MHPQWTRRNRFRCRHDPIGFRLVSRESQLSQLDLFLSILRLRFTVQYVAESQYTSDDSASRKSHTLSSSPTIRLLLLPHYRYLRRRVMALLRCPHSTTSVSTRHQIRIRRGCSTRRTPQSPLFHLLLKRQVFDQRRLDLSPKS